MKRITFTAIIITVLMLSCKKEDVSGPSNSIDLSSFSGKWLGTKTIYKAGQCSIDNGDSATYLTTMTWTVTTAGDITIQDSVQTTANLTGKIQTNHNISLRKIFNVNCFGTPTIDTTFYSGTIEQLSGTSKLNVESIEAWCPIQGCIFRVRYAIAKQ